MRSPPSHPVGSSTSRLRAEVSGRVIAPDDPDVQQVVALARDTGLELAVRSGAHSPAGHSVVDGGIVLDPAEMHALDLDPEARTAWAQPGPTAGAYTTAHEHGLATGFGDTASVGIGGLTLAGGVGRLVRKHGLTIDSLLAAERVTADGQLLRVDAEHHQAVAGGPNGPTRTRKTQPDQAAVDRYRSCVT